jgi:hypothetical protein
MRLPPGRSLAALATLLVVAGCSSSAGQSFLPPGNVGGGNVGGAGGLVFSNDGGLVFGRRDGGEPAPGSGAIAAPCTTSASCAAGVCAADVAGGGYCTADCTDNGVCPNGAACVEASATARICLKTCAPPFATCRAEQLCLSGFCLPRCTKDDDCGSASCDVDTGRCGASRVGNSCAADLDCGQAPAFCDLTRPDGYCSRPCGGSNNLSCPEETSCVSLGNAGSCLKACTAATDCRPGFLCTDTGGTRSCVPSCAENSDCAPGSRCDVASGACVGGGPPPGTVGGACAGDGECAPIGAGAYCALPASGFPDGYCSVGCATAACPSGSVCVTTDNEKDCVSACTAPADCRAGYTCFALESGNGGICFPKCTKDADCSDPAAPVCNTVTGYCATHPTGGTVVTNETINLTPAGPLSLAANLLSDRLVVTIPADAVSIDFVGEAVSNARAAITVGRLEQSADNFVTATRLYDYGSLTNQIQVAPPIVPGAFSVLYPNSPSAPFRTSTASATIKVAVRLRASAATTVKVTAIIKHAPSAVVTQGQIDLNLFFVGVPGLDAASAPTSARFQQIFDGVKSIWAKAGVSVGAVSYIDIGGLDAARFSDLNDGDLGALMTRSRSPAAKDDALNVFFVHTINGDTLSGYIILGESSGLPGVPIRGTTASGLAVTTADFPMGLEEIALTWAHEGGHCLGLFHTTELGGTAFDPLPDTPQCVRAQRDANGDKILQPGECKGFGADNLMFWTGGMGANSTLTPNQGFVLLRNPSVR